MTYIHVVITTDLQFESRETVRAFTKIEDATIFISECKRVESNNNYRYEIDSIKLDGNPLEGCF